MSASSRWQADALGPWRFARYDALMGLKAALRYDVGAAISPHLARLTSAYKAAVTPLLAGVEPDSRRFPMFDAMRLFAATSVIALHVHNGMAPGLKEPRWMGLFFAVPLFLAISGFLVLKSFGESRSWPHFAWNRFLRVTPAWIASLGLVGLLSGIHGVRSCLVFWASLGLHGSSADVPNGVYWSLGWEELMYAILAVLYGLGAYRRPIAIWCLWAVSFMAAIPIINHFQEHWWLPTAFLRMCMAVLPAAFFLGNLCYLYRHSLIRSGAYSLVALIFATACFGIRGSNYVVEFVHQQAFLFAAIWVGIAIRNPLPQLKADVSYGFYVYHLPLARLFMGMDFQSPIVPFLITVSVTTHLSLASWYLIERPALKAKNARFRLPWRYGEDIQSTAVEAA